MVAILVVVGVFWATREAPEETGHPGMTPSTASMPSADEQAPASQAPRVRAPAVQMPDQGRLEVTREALRDGEVLALGLEMPDDLRGEGPRAVKLIDPAGRVLELVADPVDGAGTGLRLEIDPEWLEPGQYMIQVETADTTPLPLRRYVLEVTSEEGSANEH